MRRLGCGLFLPAAASSRNGGGRKEGWFESVLRSHRIDMTSASIPQVLFEPTLSALRTFRPRRSSLARRTAASGKMQGSD